MKCCKHFFMFLFCCAQFSIFTPTPYANTLYINPLDGDNRNPGLSAETAQKSINPATATDRLEVIYINPDGKKVIRRNPAKGNDTEKAALSAAELNRTILGTQSVTGWQAFTQTIWQAPLDWDSGWTLIGVSVDNQALESGCAADFLGNGQYFVNENVLTINDVDGNPDETGKLISVQIYNEQTDEYSTQTVTGWTLSPTTVWQAALAVEPIHTFVDELLYDENAWYGPRSCEGETGQNGFLYLRDTEGNPDTLEKAVAVSFDTGGWAVTSGDFNGDQFPDVVHSNVGEQIYINYGKSDFSATPEQILKSPVAEAHFGFFVSSAGDVNNDGFDDLLVSMEWSVEKVYLYMGSASGLDETPTEILPPNGYTKYGFGHGIAGNGNINGDDFDDILIMGGDDSSSYLSIYLGSERGIGSEPDSVLSFKGKIYGGYACIPGDMNNDGFDEVVLSMNDTPPVDNIQLWIYNGNSTGTIAEPHVITMTIPEKSVSVCCQVAPAGDINNDGFADLIFGNQWAEGDYDNEGKAYILMGSDQSWPDVPDFTIDSPLPEFNARFANAVTGIGDFNKDGFDDVAVGCPYSQDSSGFVAIYPGSADGIVDTPLQTIEGVSNFGWSVADAGDLKGTGQLHFVAGEEQGGAYLYAMAKSCNTPFYADSDGDGYGDPNEVVTGCTQPTGYVTDNTDCNDGNADIHPGAEETCNEIDDNCNGLTDENDVCNTTDAPTANAGSDQEVVEGSVVQLDGSGSAPADATGQITAYAWTQTSGPEVVLSNAAAAKASFLTLPVSTDGAVLVFQLTVTDNNNQTATDDVAITVKDNGTTGFDDDVLTFTCPANEAGEVFGIKALGEARLTSVIQIDAATIPVIDKAMICGLFDITVQVPKAGDTAKVTYYFQTPAEKTQFWLRYGADDNWSNFSDFAVFNEERNQVTLTLVDGGTGDDDNEANGTIQHVSGLSASPDNPYINCFITTLLDE